MAILQFIILSFIAGAIGNIFGNLIYFIISKIKWSGKYSRKDIRKIYNQAVKKGEIIYDRS